MASTEEQILLAMKDAITLNRFITFCDAHSTTEKKQRLRNILAYSPDVYKTIKHLFEDMDISLSRDECERMYQLVSAYLNKSPYRIRIDKVTKARLLAAQHYKCNICGKPIDIHAHPDHIIPFKYVGDELEDNLQMLCSQCNQSKNANVDYQLRYLLKHA